MRLGDARSITGSDRMRSKKLWSEGARQDLAVHVFWDRRTEQVEKRWREIDKLCVCYLRSSFQRRPAADQDSIKPMRTAPFAFFRWTMVTNHDGRFGPVFPKTCCGEKRLVSLHQSRKRAAPSVANGPWENPGAP